MNGKAKREKKQVFPNNSVLYVLSQEELGKRMAEVGSSLKASTWHDLETHGKFGKNEKLIKMAVARSRQILPNGTRSP